MAAKPKFKQEHAAALSGDRDFAKFAAGYFAHRQVATNSIFHISRENFIVLMRIKPHCASIWCDDSLVRDLSNKNLSFCRLIYLEEGEGDGGEEEELFYRLSRFDPKFIGFFIFIFVCIFTRFHEYTYYFR